MRVARFTPRKGVRGTVVLSLGRAEPIEKYVEVIGELLGRGFVVLAHDWRGQGLSQRLHSDPSRGHARGLLPFLDDYRHLLDCEERRQPRPWLALAHSMGAGIVTASLARGETRFAGAILSAPMLAIQTRGRSRAFVRRAAALMKWCWRGAQSPFPTHRFEDEAFEENGLTHDRNRWERWRAQLEREPALRLGPPTWGWLAFAFELAAAVLRPGAMEAIAIPLVAVAAGDERLCVNAATTAALGRVASGRYVEVPGAWHELLMEVDAAREVFWREFDRLAAAVAPDGIADVGRNLRRVNDLSRRPRRILTSVASDASKRASMPDKDYPLASEFEAEKQPYPARQSAMLRQPESDLSNYRAAGKLVGKRALITGGDSGIGRAVAIAFAMEGADVAILYNENDEDAARTRAMVEAKGARCEVIKSDVRDRTACFAAVERVAAAFGGLDILINNAAFQMAQARFEDLTEAQMRRSFDTNILGYMFMAQAALAHLPKGGAIVNTGSIVGLTGLEILIDYTATKGAIHAFTKSLALYLGERGIRVNCVVPGPVWTPNIPGTMPPGEIDGFGHEVALKRPGQPEELAPAYVLLASSDGSFMTGSLVHVTGGRLSAA